MIYTAAQKAKIDAEEAAEKAARLSANGNVTTNKAGNATKTVDEDGYVTKRDRSAYMREYRKKPKKCPHCGGEL